MKVKLHLLDSLDSNTEMDDLHKTEFSAQSSVSAGGCPPVVSLSDVKWFVLRVTYSRELKAQQLLQEAGVECFIPMVCDRNAEKRCYVPVVHNLIFVHSSRDFLDDYKRKVESDCPLRYMMDRSTGLPMVVRDKEMDDFIRVTKENDEGILYLDDPSSAATKGTPVEIVSGPFKGVQGKLLRIRRDRKVVLQLVGLVAVAVDGIPMEWCRVLEV